MSGCRSSRVLALNVAAACVLVSLSCAAQRGGAGGDDVRAAFETEYQAYLEAPPPPIESSVGASDEQRMRLVAIAELGPTALPLLIERARATGDRRLTLPLGIISRVSFRHGHWPGALSKRQLDLFMEWWEGGQELTDEMFREAYAARDYERIDALGWAVMPRIVEKLREGDDKLMDAVRQIGLLETRSERIPPAAVADAQSWLAWWEANKQDWLIPFED